jgi:hypothetical protein
MHAWFSLIFSLLSGSRIFPLPRNHFVEFCQIKHQNFDAYRCRPGRPIHACIYAMIHRLFSPNPSPTGQHMHAQHYTPDLVCSVASFLLLKSNQGLLFFSPPFQITSCSEKKPYVCRDLSFIGDCQVRS